MFKLLEVRRLAVAAALGFLAHAATASPTVVYDSLGPAAPNVPSLGYEATSTSEFGDRITLAPGPRTLDSVTVRMSSWALQSTYAGDALYANPAGWNQSLTFNIYGAGSGDSPGSLIASSTITTLAPWRPAADPACSGGAWKATDGNCYNGLAFDVIFNFGGSGVVLPDQLVFGLAFNTADYGASPTHQPGPYNSLNFGYSTAGATTGTDVNPDAAFVNTSWAGFLANPANVGSFLQDTGYSPYVPAVQFVTVGVVSEPGSLALVAGGMLAALTMRRRAHASTA